MSDFWTPAHYAVEHEDVEALARLLADGADPDEVFSGMTLLTRALDTEGDVALQSGRPLSVHATAVLLAFGADPELADPDGRTPVDVATFYDHGFAVKLLRTHITNRAGGSRRRSGRWWREQG
ncbi:ankyrin repeat domain-containing protein [Streptomyces sp. NPDC091278]|uniref:ankyrin repeat domain-containing protein n=1 Tax=Streptomyces sp. NPDC091278 TaxID=3155301 RepID=UPI00345054DF